MRKALRNERQIMQIYEKSFEKYENEFSKNDKIRNERIVKNHAQVAAFGDALSVLFPKSMTKERQEKLACFLQERAVAREQRLAHDHPLVEQFWETVQFINNTRINDNDEYLNHSNHEDEIAINLNQYRAECVRNGQELPDMTLLKKLLPQCKRYKCLAVGRNVSSCWENAKPMMGSSHAKPCVVTFSKDKENP